MARTFYFSDAGGGLWKTRQENEYLAWKRLAAAFTNSDVAAAKDQYEEVFPDADSARMAESIGQHQVAVGILKRGDELARIGTVKLVIR